MAIDSISSANAAGRTGAAAGQQGGASELNEQFLTLLVAQMKNQDPMNPTDNSKVTSQIAQINTVSGINQLNDTLQGITGQIDKSQQLQAASLSGRDVLVPGDAVKVGENGTAMPFGIDLPRDAANVKITLADDSGTVVHQSEYTDQAAGIQSFAWDGQTNDASVGPGRYTLNVEAVDGQGKAVDATTLSTARVNGVVMGDERGQGPMLDLGPAGLVTLEQVSQVL